MSYLALARKYRPQTFDEIVGQEHVTRTLKNAIGQGRIHHAFLFAGARGVGKTTAARVLAKALSCVQAPTATPCNACEACREITAGASVDVQEIDAASNNGVDNIRELREAIRYAPVRGKKKVYILDEVHMLSGGAWNALLKTLEEPPPHAVFIFATTDPHKLPPTILSRVQRYDFKLLATRQLTAHLASILDAEKIKHEPAALQLVAREAAGSVRDALSLLDQVIASAGAEGVSEAGAAEVLGVADRRLLRDLARAVLQRDPKAVLERIDAAFERGYDLAQLAQALLAHLRDLIVLKSVESPEDLVEGDAAELAELRAELHAVAPGRLELMFDRLCRMIDEISRSAQPRYVLEVGLLELMRVEPLEPISGLLAKLQALEARLEGRVDSRQLTVDSRGQSQNRDRDLDPNANANANANANVNQHESQGGSYNRLIEAVLEIEPRLSTLALSRLVVRDQRRLSIAFDKEFDAEQVRARLPQLRAALKQATGSDLEIEIAVGASGGGGAETLVEAEQRKVAEERQRRVQEALDHPMRKKLEEKFGGSWNQPVVDNLEKDG